MLRDSGVVGYKAEVNAFLRLCLPIVDLLDTGSIIPDLRIGSGPTNGDLTCRVSSDGRLLPGVAVVAVLCLAPHAQ